MNKLKTFFLLCALLFGVLSFASPVFAQKTTSGLIPCGNDETTGQVTAGLACDYKDLVALAQTVINFLIFGLAAPLGAIMFAYAGFLYVTNGGNESKIKEAHDIFLYVFWGLVAALAAWLIVNYILVFLLGAGSSFNFLS